MCVWGWIIIIIIIINNIIVRNTPATNERRIITYEGKPSTVIPRFTTLVPRSVNTTKSCQSRIKVL